MTITNKFLNENSQKNIRLNMDYYNDEEVDGLQENGFVTLIESTYSVYVVFLSDVSRVEVEPDESGTLTTVAYMKHYDERLYVDI